MIRFAESETLALRYRLPKDRMEEGVVSNCQQGKRGKKKKQLKLPIQFKVKYVTMLLLETNTNYQLRLN